MSNKECVFSRFLSLNAQRAKRGQAQRKKEIEKEMLLLNASLNHYSIMGRYGDLSKRDEVRKSMEDLNNELSKIVK